LRSLRKGVALSSPLTGERGDRRALRLMHTVVFQEKEMYLSQRDGGDFYERRP
jgi:hypothetical protein